MALWKIAPLRGGRGGGDELNDVRSARSSCRKKDHNNHTDGGGHRALAGGSTALEGKGYIPVIVNCKSS